MTKLKRGTAVISLADGKKLGSVDRVLLDPVHKEIVGFTFVHGGGLFGGKTSALIEITDVHAFGPDPVMVRDASVVHSDLAVSGKCDGLVDLEDLLKREVVSDGGAILGKVASIRFGEQSHQLEALEVAADAPEGRREIAGDTVMSIGEELVVVADAANIARPARVELQPQPVAVSFRKAPEDEPVRIRAS